MKPIFALARILGNEMPPRDVPDGRLISLQHLIREPPLCGVIKFWIINRVWDPRLAATYRKLLSTVVGLVHELPFEPGRYFEAQNQHEQLLYCPGINNARNEGLRIAFEEYDVKFAAIFDGDCGFTPDQWNTVSSEIFGDCVNCVERQAYSVPMVRVDPSVWEHALVGPPNIIPDDPHEPQLIISRRAWEKGLCYDESLAFDENDKVRLLENLGHHTWIDRWHETLREDQCRSIGRCCHVNTGSDMVEASIHEQWSARQKAKAQFHADITRYYQGSYSDGSV
jgi:hypothetical protein